MRRRCVHGVIGICVACTILAAVLPVNIDRDDHAHHDPAPTEYVGSTGYSVQPTTNTMPVGRSSMDLPSFGRRDAQYAAALGWYGESSSTSLLLRASTAASTS